jgi:hypothetical protein
MSDLLDRQSVRSGAPGAPLPSRLKILVLFAVLALGGCYSPSLRDCTVACSSPADCGGDQTCNDGWCAGPAASCAGVLPDGQSQADGMPDAQSLCEQGCPNGTCVGGVCVIDCAGPDACAQEVMCPPNVPCKVVCGDRSCDRLVVCGAASSCVVECKGVDACAEEVRCGMAPCDVTCSGAGSCKKKVKCKESCRCDVTCSGLGACAEPMECPLMMDTCRLGKGCSSELAGCDRCD